MRKPPPNTTAKINSILLRAAMKADRVVDRSEEQKELRVAKMRAELTELGYSIVTTIWLDAILDGRTAASMRRGIGE